MLLLSMAFTISSWIKDSSSVIPWDCAGMLTTHTMLFLTLHSKLNSILHEMPDKWLGDAVRAG